MKIAFSSSHLSAMPDYDAQHVHFNFEATDELRQILSKHSINPFNKVTPALSNRLTHLNDCVSIDVQHPKPDKIEVSVHHTAHLHDTIMKKTFATQDVVDWLDKIHQIEDFKSLLVIKQFTNGTVKVIAPFQPLVKKLQHDILSAPFYTEGLRPLLVRAKTLSKFQDKIVANIQKSHKQEMNTQHTKPNPLWFWKSNT